jgi:hypothetical protein
VEKVNFERKYFMKEPLVYLAFQKSRVKKLYLYLKYGNELLKKKITPPEKTIEKFVFQITTWILLANFAPSLSLFFLPKDLDPVNYLKIGQVAILVCILFNTTVWVLIKIYPTSWLIQTNSADLVSQSESISILITVIYMLLFIGVMAYNTFAKIEKRRKFFRGIK